MDIEFLYQCKELRKRYIKDGLDDHLQILAKLVQAIFCPFDDLTDRSSNIDDGFIKNNTIGLNISDFPNNLAANDNKLRKTLCQVLSDLGYKNSYIVGTTGHDFEHTLLCGTFRADWIYFCLE